MKQIEVVAAIIIFDSKILCVKRDHHKYNYLSFKYEFPGGKVEENETNEIALIREIDEELNMKINIENNFLTVNHIYPDFSIKMYSFICSCENSKLKLTEHVEYKWLTKDRLLELDWAEADLPIVHKLMEM
ncbi:MAG: (deoxy)nucleoside triphosphate pyrophosphohydrolase [Ignavibacteria bacterium]